jgi:hypothetical protein
MQSNTRNDYPILIPNPAQFMRGLDPKLRSQPVGCGVSCEPAKP